MNNDVELISLIKDKDENALKIIYKDNYHMIVNMILKNSGTEQEAKDIFQEALIVFWKKAISDDFVLTSKISTFIYSITLNLWRKELTRKKKFTDEIFEGTYSFEDDSFFDTKSVENQVLMECVQNLSPNCVSILTSYYFDGFSMTKISEMLGHSNRNTTKTMKYKCMKKLISTVKYKFMSRKLEYTEV